MVNKNFYFHYWAILFLTILLASCSHVKRDGPPNFYVDETKIPNAKPKAERLSKYGNMPSYQVFGNRYYVMKQHDFLYDEVGIASWYGTKFHTRRTSSGERYNMLSMTAAHKTLPLPTYVQVTNLHNHKKIIVKVNDRGPFAPGRIIDLSYVAAKKLGITAHGTAKVRVTAINPYVWNRPATLFAQNTHIKPVIKTVEHSRSVITPTKQYYSNSRSQFVYIQVGAFREQANAMHLRSQILSYLQVPIRVFRPTLFEKLYRVQIGPFTDLSSADKISLRLKTLGFKSSKKYGVY